MNPKKTFFCKKCQKILTLTFYSRQIKGIFVVYCRFCGRNISETKKQVQQRQELNEKKL